MTATTRPTTCNHMPTTHPRSVERALARRRQCGREPKVADDLVDTVATAGDESPVCAEYEQLR